MGRKNKHHIICALDTGDVNVALATVERLKDYCGAFKIGHALTLPNGLSVIDRLQDAGAERVFLDLKFHDIPSSVGIAVREAAKHRVWMMTVHLSGGPAMLSAAVEEAKFLSETERPLLVGVSVLTSMDQETLNEKLGVQREIKDHMLKLSEMGMQTGMDGMVCSVEEVADMRSWFPKAVLVTPGIRAHSGALQDQTRVGDGRDALNAGSDYLVIGRPLTGADDPEKALQELRLCDD
ncbi:MAG: orotidine-5'-phosphate decarboxylase [Fimbriimonadaceae bacterium]